MSHMYYNGSQQGGPPPPGQPGNPNDQRQMYPQQGAPPYNHAYGYAPPPQAGYAPPPQHHHPHPHAAYSMAPPPPQSHPMYAHPPPPHHSHPNPPPYYHTQATPPPPSHMNPTPPPHSNAFLFDDSQIEDETKKEGISIPHPHDVLCGRGGATNNHVGNSNYRKLVNHNKRLYITCPKRHKIIVSRSIVEAVRRQNPSGRFLEKRNDGLWYDIGHKKALEKTSQALRENATEIRKELTDGQTLNIPGTIEEDSSAGGIATTRIKEKVRRSINRKIEREATSHASVYDGSIMSESTHAHTASVMSRTDAESMPPPPNVVSSNKMTSERTSRKPGVAFDEESINTSRSELSRRRQEGLKKAERDALSRIHGLKSRSKSKDAGSGNNKDDYEPAPIPSGSWGGDTAGLSFGELGGSMSMGTTSFGMNSLMSNGHGDNGMQDDMSIGMIAEAVFGSSHSIGMNSAHPSMGSQSREWAKNNKSDRSAMSYDDLSAMMEESIKSFQSLGLNGSKIDDEL